jgi:hypothetical protein
VRDLPKRDFEADGPFEKPGTDVGEFRVADAKAYPAPVYDMASQGDHRLGCVTAPDLAQRQRLLGMLEDRPPRGRAPDPALGAWAGGSGAAGGGNG